METNNSKKSQSLRTQVSEITWNYTIDFCFKFKINSNKRVKCIIGQPNETNATTNELITIEPLDLNLAAPNLAKALGLARPEGAPAGTGAKVIETPASKEAAVSQAEALGEVTNKTKDVISLIRKTRDLINPYSTGYGSLLKIYILQSLLLFY